MSRGRATAVGFLAVLLWALLALFTVRAAATPPFQLSALAFAVGAGVGFADMARRGVSPWALLRQPWPVWAVGVGGLFGYHFLYFTALRNAPPAEASLIAYLWPLLIVLFSGLLPGERLRPSHVMGALIAFCGAALIVGRGAGGFDAAHAVGYVAAAGCALTWSGYSVLSRRVETAPTDAVSWFCLATAVLSALCHVALERTAWPPDATSWLAVLALGLGPVGAAFYFWDVGVKRGDIQLLGVAAYAAPALSTGALVAAGVAEPTPRLFVAAALIAGGAALAASGSARRSA